MRADFDTLGWHLFFCSLSYYHYLSLVLVLICPPGHFFALSSFFNSDTIVALTAVVVVCLAY